VPRWIEAQSQKAERLKTAKAAHATLLERHVIRRRDEADIDARSKAAELARVKEPTGRGIRPGPRTLPYRPDADLAEALSRADSVTPRRLDYPHLLIFRDRGFTRSVWGSTGAGENGANRYQGDVLTEAGKQWLQDWSARRAA
jgi:hypothetical protein